MSKSLVLVAGVASMAYMFSDAKWEQKFAFFMFMLSFSPIFKFSKEQTSLFMFLKIGVILSYLFQKKGKFSFTFITLVIAFFTYCFVLSQVYDTDYFVRLINFVIWIFVGYIIVNSLKKSAMTPVARSLINGVIITGVIGLFLNNIPQLLSEITVETTYAEDGALVYRFAAFWKDPNYFTALLITSVWLLYFEYNRKRVNSAEFISKAFILTFVGFMTMSKSCLLLLMIFWIYVIVSKNDIKTAPKVLLIFAMIFAVIIFMWRNPYWLSDILYRFGSDRDSTTLDTITTGRTRLWSEYLKRILDDFTWIFGHGVGASLLEINGSSIGSHNTLIQSVYTFGVLGTALYIWIFKNMYDVAKKSITISSRKGPEKYALISILLTLLFLDGIYIEMYYYALPLLFAYIINDNGYMEEGLHEVKTNISL